MDVNLYFIVSSLLFGIIRLIYFINIIVCENWKWIFEDEAVIGGGAVGWGIAIVFILLIGGGFVAVRVRRNKRKFSKKSSKK